MCGNRSARSIAMRFRNIDEQCYISRSLSAQEAIDQAACSKSRASVHDH